MEHLRFVLVVVPTIICACCLPHPSARCAEASIALAGEWRFQLDRTNVGIEERWFDRLLPGTILLPGSLPGRGIGDDVTAATKWTGDILDSTWFTSPDYERYRRSQQVKVPFWLQPDKYYAGAAWYQRDFDLPSGWRTKRVVLMLERPHWVTQVWCDGREVGRNTSLSTPHVYDLGTSRKPGRHQITVRVDNSIVVDIGVNSHSITDHTQGNWNGLVGRLELRSTPPIWIDDLRVSPDASNRTVEVQGTIGNVTGRSGKGAITVTVANRPGVRIRVGWEPGGGSFAVKIPMGDTARVWNEFNPALYMLTAVLDGGKHSKSVTFGLRDISAAGSQLLLNGQKLFLRGTLECAIFPATGHPPTDVDSWKRVIGAAKAHGLNLFRFHSWCPPEAAFAAADEMGFYLHVEAASWANQSTSLGDGKPVDRWVYAETDCILREYGNHPSFLFMLYGNEPGGAKSGAYLARWVDHCKALDSRRLYSSGAGWPQIPENQFHVTPKPRIQAWGKGLGSRINARPPETTTDYRSYIQERPVPVISHEIGQWCVYPNFAEISKYNGYLKPRNFEIFRDGLEAHHMGDQAHQFLIASGKLQALCYKEEIESALRTPGMGGFELLDLHDFPGQGTALVGVLDPFWESKGYITPAEFRRFCNTTVPLARLSRRVFTNEDSIEADIEVAHFGPGPLENAIPYWKLVDSRGNIAAQGRFPAKDIPLGNAIPLGHIQIIPRQLAAPACYRLIAGLDGTEFENDWDVWIYPARVPEFPPNTITVTRDLTDSVVALLDSGGKVLLMIPPDRTRGDSRGPVALGFSSIFWNTSWTGRQAPHTLGILCDPDHPALEGFPTESHSNYHWWYLLSRAGAMILDSLPAGFRPIVQVIDDWVTNRKLGVLFEARVGNGRLIVTSIDIYGSLQDNPVARQLRYSLARYMGSERFQPSPNLTADQLRRLIAGP